MRSLYLLQLRFGYSVLICRFRYDDKRCLTGKKLRWNTGRWSTDRLIFKNKNTIGDSRVFEPEFL